MRILAIDPGPERSAWLLLEDGSPIGAQNINLNAEVLEGLRSAAGMAAAADTVVIEEIASYGMPVGREVFQTVRWSGRFEEACSVPVVYIPRLTVKLNLCHSPKANDATIRAALIDRFGRGGGRVVAIGNKARPGPLYGIHADLWSALALAVTFADSQL